MLQCGEVLRTWALPVEPTAGATMTAAALPDHRLDYLDYEGPLTHDRGTVARVDAGSYEIERESDAELVVRLDGAKLVGRATLVRQPILPSDGAAQCWTVSFSIERSATSGMRGVAS